MDFNRMFFSARFMIALVCGFAIFPALAEQQVDSSVIPHLDKKGHQGYAEFLAAPKHRAFAIATGGAWSWVSGLASPEEASAVAVNDCAQYTPQKCLPYAIDDEVVFEPQAWASSWEPFLSEAEATNASIGVMRNNRFPDLSLTTPDGRPVTLSDLKGRVVFLHFWGSWCPPCQAEFPELQKLYDAFGDTPGISFVLVQTRESIDKSRRWTKRNGVSMPLYDSGTKGRKDTVLKMADGKTIEDRRLAPVFPSTYVLDRNGVVIFNHAGPATGWPTYAPLLRHVMKAK